MRTDRPLRVCVATGGVTGERPISLATGEAVANALAEVGHDVVVADLTERDATPVAEAQPDICFVAIHGAFGEDGGLQAQLERLRIPYTGSGVEASERAFDKRLAKHEFGACGIPTPMYTTAVRETFAWALDGMATRVEYPLVIKPACEGSSLGVTIAHDEEQAIEGARIAFDLGDGLLIEQYIGGRELGVAVLDGHPLPAFEVRPSQTHTFYDYDAKYAAGDTDYDFKPALTAEQLLELQDIAMDAYDTLGCGGYARVDFRECAHTGQFLVLEVNTIPGFTSTSLFPKAAAAAGITFPTLCDRLLRIALRDGVQRRRRLAA